MSTSPIIGPDSPRSTSSVDDAESSRIQRSVENIVQRGINQSSDAITRLSATLLTYHSQVLGYNELLKRECSDLRFTNQMLKCVIAFLVVAHVYSYILKG